MYAIKAQYILCCLLSYFILNIKTANAQDSGFFTGGSIGFSYTHNDPKTITSTSNDIGHTSTLLSATPFLGYSFNEKQMAGIAPEYNLTYTNMRGIGYEKSIRNDFFINPFMRYYFKSYFFT